MSLDKITKGVSEGEEEVQGLTVPTSIRNLKKTTKRD